MRSAFLVLLLVTRPLLAGYAARDLVLPVAGRAISPTRVFHTAVWITNVSQRPATITTSFLEAGHANPSPLRSQLQLAPGATHLFDPLDVPTTGALRIESNVDVIASARISSNDFATSFPAVPVRIAIGNGQSAALHGYSPSHYKLYVVEIGGEPLAYSVTIEDAEGRIRGEKRLYLDRYEQRPLDLGEFFPNLDGALVRVAGTNGNGRLIAMGLQTTSQDASAFEMSFPATSRFAMSWIEAASYIAVAMAVIAAALIRR
jgi:hypothetical protein